MAGQRIIVNGTPCFIDYHDGKGSCVIGKTKYRWEFHHYCGPAFFRGDKGTKEIFPGEKHPVWPFFEAWHKKYKKAREKAKSHEIVKV